MRWPFVSRRAYDLVCEERDLLRVKHDDLVDNLKRIQRVRHGMREVPKVVKEHVPADEPIPREIEQLYAGFQSPAVRRTTETAIREMREHGTPWGEIRRLLESQLGEPVS